MKILYHCTFSNQDEFLKLLINTDGKLEINYDDELLGASLMTREGKLFNERKVNS